VAFQDVKDDTDLLGLVELVKNNQRSKPVCVVSTPASSPGPAFDTQEIDRQVGDIAFLYILPTGDLSRKFVDKLGPKAAVFNGAAKVFSPDWQELEEWPKVHYCQEAFKDKDTESLISQIWKHADQKDLQKLAQRNTVDCEGQVTGFIGSRAFVRTNNGMLATIRQELLAPGVPLEWLFTVGQLVRGKLNKEERLFIPALNERTLQSIADQYGHNNLVLVLIKQTERKKGLASIYPGIDVEFTLNEISGNELDLVTDFLEPGQVVAMRIYKDPQGRTRLKMNDIDDDEEAVEAVSVVEGGQPWLLPDRDIPIEEEQGVPQHQEPLNPEVEEPQVEEIAKLPPTPHPGNYAGGTSSGLQPLTGNDLASWKGYAKGLTNKIESLKEEIKSLVAELVAVTAEKNEAKRKLKELQRSSTSSKRKTAARDPNKSTTRSRRNRWASNEDWFNEELRRVWISRYTPQERNLSYPLKFTTFSYGEPFFESLEDSSLTEDELRKSVRVIVDIVTGRESDSRQNRVHPLRETESPSSPTRRRADGSTAWRANIEDKTSQARRLHFWKLPDGRIELAKIVKHDDATI